MKIRLSFDMGMGVSTEGMLIVSVFNGENIVSPECWSLRLEQETWGNGECLEYLCGAWQKEITRDTWKGCWHSHQGEQDFRNGGGGWSHDLDLVIGEWGDRVIEIERSVWWWECDLHPAGLGRERSQVGSQGIGGADAVDTKGEGSGRLWSKKDY